MEGTKEPLLSVVVPVYNGADFLRECLDSILAQTMPDFELICVDDGSADETPQILQAYAGQDTRITVIRQENAGVSAARNTGLDHASGKYILFFDDDDLTEPQMFAQMTGRLEEDAADVCVCGGYRLDMRTGERHEVKGLLRRGELPEELPFSPIQAKDHLFDFTTFFSQNKICARALLKERGIRFKPYRTSEDALFWCDVMSMAERITVSDEPLFTYRRNAGGNLSSTIDRDIYAGYHALSEIRRSLEERGVLEVYEQSFVNKAQWHLLTYLDGLHTYEAFSEYLLFLKESGFKTLGISDRDAAYYYDEKRYQQMQEILNASDPGETAFFRYVQTKTDKEFSNSRVRLLREQKEKLQEKNGKLQEKNGKLQEKNGKLQNRNEKLQEKNEKLRIKNADLKEQIARIEASRAYRFAMWFHRLAVKLGFSRKQSAA